MTAPFRIARLDAAHDRAKFCSGSESLDRYLRELAMQDIRRRVAACFVALADTRRIAGYYTLNGRAFPNCGTPKPPYQPPPASRRRKREKSRRG
ncbi:MAG: hypothetical protein LBB60_06250 [Desulfovibrio sp.]|jgi:hypothetical protein|nr:hypothetical protein [Desulfovibrio sp.]